MIYRHSIEQIKDYERNDAINQTAIKAILSDGFQAFYEESTILQRQEDDEFKEEPDHFLIGKAVDIWITNSKEVFDQLYHVSKLKKKPGATAMSVIRRLYSSLTAKEPAGTLLSLDTYKKEIYDAANDSDFYLNRKQEIWEDDKRWQTLVKDNGDEYFQDLIKGSGKKILSDPQSEVVSLIVRSYINHENTRHLLRITDDIDIVFQFPMYWIFQGVRCKGLVDEVLIDHKSKIIKIIDYKTLGDFILRFNRAVRKRRYDIQGSYYYEGLHHCKGDLGKLVGKDLSAYTIKNFAFAVESTKAIGYPIIFVLSDDAMMIGRMGNGRELKGWLQGLMIYKEWQDAGFDIERRLKNSHGVLFIDQNFEYPNY